MDVCYEKKVFPYLKIRNYYNEEELALIWQELEFLSYQYKLQPPQKTGQNNPNMKHNHGLFLDDVYMKREYSNILKVNRKTFSAEIFKLYAGLHEMYENIFMINNDSTLLSYYENNGYYKSHSDVAAITSLQWIFKEPKRFTGGNLILTKYNETIEIENNMMIMFPSFLKHEVTAVEMDKEYCGYKGNGRYCLSQFMNIQ
jgi:Rps23 Pro-64 3,4-dihydroxylase Tpa1-like proline 4-hydroxylase